MPNAQRDPGLRHQDTQTRPRLDGAGISELTPPEGGPGPADAAGSGTEQPASIAWGDPRQLDHFIAEHYLRQPWLERGGVRAPLDGWSILEAIIPTACDLSAARDSLLHPGGRPASLAEARAWHAAGWTLVARRVHEHERRCAELAEDFARGLDGRVDVQLYLSPRQGRSFGWHLDPEEVFLLQVAGEKTIRLRENTACPQPLLERMPGLDALACERGPTLGCSLAAGDWLYIPGGWWHDAQAATDACTVSVGVMALTALEALDCLRGHLLRCHVVRARLPPTGTWASGQPRSETAMTTISAVGDLIGSQMRDAEFVRALPALARQRERRERERRCRRAHPGHATAGAQPASAGPATVAHGSQRPPAVA